MLSIQIDTKSLELIIYIKSSLFASHMKSSFPLCTFKIDAVRLLDPLLCKPKIIVSVEDISDHLAKKASFLSLGRGPFSCFFEEAVCSSCMEYEISFQ